MIHTALTNYRKLERPIVFVIAAEFCLQLISTSFSLVLNIYMAKHDYLDHQIADIGSYRFLGALLIALPLGLWIKHRKIKPILYLACGGVPLTALLIVFCIGHHLDLGVRSGMFLMGFLFPCLEITVMPFILRNAALETQPEAISLNFSVWAIGTVASGLLIFSLRNLHTAYFDEAAILTFIALAGFGSLWFVYNIRIEEKVPAVTDHHRNYHFDWDLITKALVPPFLIAVGAGLTIPFLNLFFFKVYDMDSEKFSFLNSMTAVLVSITSILIPQIQRRYGFKIAICLSQSLAILALLLLASTEFYKNSPPALYIAILFFMLRQPLMNMAGPMTSYLAMSYIGKNNHEIYSALCSGMWSGSWYVSSQIFRYLRHSGFCYANIFFITGGIYILGTVGYYLLILDYHRREALKEAA